MEVDAFREKVPFSDDLQLSLQKRRLLLTRTLEDA